MNENAIHNNNGFEKKADWMATFAALPKFFELSGPGSLVRLVQFKKVTYDGLRLGDSRRAGLFWFEEELLVRVRNQARSELLRQQAESKGGFKAPLSSLVTLYIRHVFRNDLAVSKDWTNDFDGYVRIRLLEADKLVALVGPVARQSAYSKEHSKHESVVASNIWLEGQATQYVIDFTFPANKPYVQRIQGPFEF